MRAAVYPFASTGDLTHNLTAIRRGAGTASAQGARLLVFHECALCGYPPLETDCAALTPDGIDEALAQVAALSRGLKLYIAVGTVRFRDGERYNSVVLFDPQGEQVGGYDKTALWGWDAQNFRPGQADGLFEVEGLRIGFRICYDVRFPELFTPLFLRGADACFVCFSDAAAQDDPERREILTGHLRTRAVENAMTVVSVNTQTGCPAAPTAVFDPDGRRVCQRQGEGLLVFSLERTAPDFGRTGRIENRRRFLARRTE